jgi:hypothetical protein
MTSDEPMRPLWTCPKCGKRFVNERNWHSCRVVPLDSPFVGKGAARELFDAYLAAVRTIGPFDLDISLGGVALMTRVRFAGAKVRRNRLRVGFWLRRRVESPRVVRTEHIPPDNWIYEVDIREQLELDEELLGWLREAYLIGEQRHPAQGRYRLGPNRETAPADRSPAG